jgi:hypothetical protein
LYRQRYDFHSTLQPGATEQILQKTLKRSRSKLHPSDIVAGEPGIPTILRRQGVTMDDNIKTLHKEVIKMSGFFRRL